MSDPIPYNPLDKKHLGISVANELLRCDAHPLGELQRFKGAGIYAIYYNGDSPLYTKLVATSASESQQYPIYIGKAVPPGSRQGIFGLDQDPGDVLYKRLMEHAKSIRAASSTLNIDHFHCRYLVVEDIWIPLGESLLINRFAPPWNKVLDGFGNHDPGKGRYEQQRSRWDIVHPGRRWADRCTPNNTSAEEIHADLKSYLDSIIPTIRFP